MFERLFALETFGIKLGLDNIRTLCDALSHPERSFTSLHVAGTNGKGSVTAMVHAALLAAGINAARYTSPHLVDLRERFVVGTSPVDDVLLQGVVNAVLDVADRLHREGSLHAIPTFFEATTAVAFELFARQHVTAAVIEVGLGGRFDATNVVEAPVGAITSIALDHQQYLGNTLDRIAFEKAGIIKPGMTVVAGVLPAAASIVVRQIAAERGARLIESERDVRIDSVMEEGRARLTITTPAGSYGPLRLALRGEHQVRNAITAVRMLEAAREAGLDVPEGAVSEGLEQAQWPARLELLALPGGRHVLIDAAHNAEGAHALASYLARWHPERPALVVGIMSDKDADAILGELLPVTSEVVATAADTPRAMPADELARRARALEPGRAIRACSDVLTAVQTAFETSRTVCVAGSIFLAGAVRAGLESA